MELEITVKQDGKEVSPEAISAETWANLRNKKEKERTHRTGNRYKWPDGEEYILALTNDSHCFLVSLVDGLSWGRGETVVNIGKITQKEFDEITDGCPNFTLIHEAQ